MESMMNKLKRKLRFGPSREEKLFLENGSDFLEKLITDCNGKSIPIRSFSSSQILKATNNFDDSSRIFTGDWMYEWYKCKIEDKSYLIKKFNEFFYLKKESYNGVVLSARMSNHCNFLKLIGCCLEFRFPVFVFEDAKLGVLNDKGGIMVNGEESILPWNLRLKIGKEIANALTYLHMAFPKIIIHRDVRPDHIFLDKNWTAKLSDLSLSVTLPEGKSRIHISIQGTFGYLDSLYSKTGFVSEYTALESACWFFSLEYHLTLSYFDLCGRLVSEWKAR